MIDLLLFSLPTWLVAVLAFGWPVMGLCVALLVGRALAWNDERVTRRDEAGLVELIARNFEDVEERRRQVEEFKATGEEFGGLTFVWPGERAFAERAMDADGLGGM